MPIALLTIGRAEAEAADGDRDHRGAEPVEVAGRLFVAAFGDMTRGRPHGEHDERHVDEERDAPRDRVDEDAADERSEDGRGRSRRGPHPVRAPLGFAREVRCDQREGTGHQDRAGRTLQNARHHEEFHIRCETAQNARESEADESDEEDASPAVIVRQRACKDEKRREREEVPGVHVELALEHPEHRRRELAADLRQRDGDHGRVDEHDR